MATDKETCLNHIAPDDYILFSSSEKKWINKIIKFQDKYPDLVKIVHMPEDNYGVLYAMLPEGWFNIRPPRQVNLTDEQKIAVAERLRRGKYEEK